LDRIINDESTTQFPHFERKLARDISTEDDKNRTLQHFCEEYGEEVEILKIDNAYFNCEVEESGYIQGLIYTLENNLCPNLRSLYMDLFKYRHPTKFPLNLPLMPKLEFISFWSSANHLAKDYRVI
jgi:hypothetical protein